MFAVAMLQNYEYLDSTPNIPASIRGRVHPSLKVNGRLRLYKGEGGYLFSRDAKHDQAMVMFMKGAAQVIVVLPTKILERGKTFRNLSDQTADTMPKITVLSSQPLVRSANNVFDKFVFSLFSTFGTQIATFRNFHMRDTLLASNFGGSNLQTNATSIANALLPEVRQVISDGRFTLRDLINLSPVSRSWPVGHGSCVYIRIYTHPRDRPADAFSDTSQSDINQNVYFYVGQSVDVRTRAREHDRLISPDATSTHYKRAFQSQHRYMIPLLFWPGERISKNLLDMAEQTMMLAFNTYQPWVLKDVMPGKNSAQVVEFQRQAQFLTVTAQATAQKVGWPRLNSFGCNINSPIFVTGVNKFINCIRMPAGDSNLRTFTTYRVRRTIRKVGSELWNLSLTLFDPDTITSSMMTFSFKPENEAMRLQQPGVGYLVFEVMDDKKPHPNPWVGMPSVGPFRNFDRASSFAVRVEWFDESQGEWYSIPLQRIALDLRPVRQWVAQRDFESLVRLYRTAMNLIQALEGVEYTGPLDGFTRSLTFGHLTVRELQTDHLGQRYRWVDRPTKTCPVPARATWEENYNLMIRQFSSTVTHVGPSAPPTIASDVMIREVSDTVQGTSTVRPSDNSGTGTATWHTDTAGPTGDDTTYVAVQDDGNIVLYKNEDEPIWATHSNK
ncbi:hypothetical protein CDV31_014441 [Fusarium ambrosium]|uniref:Bulb-type lectin domain-containing protein n=1 Tax=Fusarium ambrosium TaxID=131363 RepID=A0A428SWH3_9HYPO|nr:hypothetical protein CDV31_014441 [Fusarium ambrosium]